MLNRNLRPQTPDRQPVSRLPLYPVGSTINHQPYQPIYEMPKKFSSFANLTMPSYQQRLIERQKEHSRVKIPHEDLERQLIAKNQAEVDSEYRRRELMQASYLREIERLQIILAKGDERKEKLKSEIQLLGKDRKELQQRMDEARANMPRFEVQSGLENKQLEVMELKNTLVARLRDKEEDMLKERQEEQQIWNQKLKEKQRTLIAYEEQRTVARNELLRLRREAEIDTKQPASSVAEIARGRKYQEFKYDLDVLKQKIVELTEERAIATRDFNSTNYLKTIVVKDQQFKLESLRRIKAGLEENINEISLRNAQLQRSNQNLEEENQRKEEFILSYERDIEVSRRRAEENDSEIHSRLNQFRSRQNPEFQSSVAKEIEELERLIREVQSDTYRLRGDYKKIGEYLESQVTKAIYQTFNDTKTQ